jgi:hypothetical protein
MKGVERIHRCVEQEQKVILEVVKGHRKRELHSNVMSVEGS